MGFYESTKEMRAMSGSHPDSSTSFSPRWRQAVILVMIFGFSLLIWVTVKTYPGAPPIPARVIGEPGQALFTGEDIQDGQEVFLKYGLMEHGSLWGHGAYLGPDYTAEYLHRLAEIGRDTLAQARYGKAFQALDEGRPWRSASPEGRQIKQNRYDPASDTLRLHGRGSGGLPHPGRRNGRPTSAGAKPAPGLPAKYIQDQGELGI